MPPLRQGFFSQGSNFTKRKTKGTLGADDKDSVPAGKTKDQSRLKCVMEKIMESHGILKSSKSTNPECLSQARGWIMSIM